MLNRALGKAVLASSLAVVSCVALTTACTSDSGNQTKPSRSCVSMGGPQITVKYSRDHLSGFGATRATFDQHRPDSGADPAAGCRYDPGVLTSLGFRDRYDVAGSRPDLVNVLTRYFPRGTTQQQAVAALVMDDLPPDAKLVRERRGDSCQMYLYRSNLMQRGAATLGDGIDVNVYSTESGSTYKPRSVLTAVLVASQDLGPC